MTPTTAADLAAARTGRQARAGLLTARALAAFIAASIAVAAVIVLAFGVLLLMLALHRAQYSSQAELQPDQLAAQVASAVPVVAILVATAAAITIAAALLAADRVLLRSVDAEPADEVRHQWLHATVARLAARAGIPTPSLAVAHDEAPGLFAVGYGPGRASMCVSSGALTTIPADELEVALAHEIALIASSEVRPASVAAVLAGGIVQLLRAAGTDHGPPKTLPASPVYRSRRTSSADGGARSYVFWDAYAFAHLVHGAGQVVLAALSPGASLVQRAASDPARTLLADADAVRLAGGNADLLVAALRRFASAPRRRWWDERLAASLEFVPPTHGNRAGVRAGYGPNADQRIEQLLPPGRPGRPDAAIASYQHPRELPAYGVSTAHQGPWVPPSAQTPFDHGSGPPPPPGYSG